MYFALLDSRASAERCLWEDLTKLSEADLRRLIDVRLSKKSGATAQAGRPPQQPATTSGAPTRPAAACLHCRPPQKVCACAVQVRKFNLAFIKKAFADRGMQVAARCLPQPPLNSNLS